MTEGFEAETDLAEEQASVEENVGEHVGIGGTIDTDTSMPAADAEPVASAEAEVDTSDEGVSAEAGVEVAGQELEAGVHVGETSGVDLPFVSVDVPTPQIAAAGEVLGAGIGAVKHLVGGSEPDDHAVTTDEFGGPKHIAPGAKPID
jgi:hypothetical protein